MKTVIAAIAAVMLMAGSATAAETVDSCAAKALGTGWAECWHGATKESPDKPGQAGAGSGDANGGGDGASDNDDGSASD